MEEAAVKFELVDINDILKTLPHRFPMLLIDRVIKIRAASAAAADALDLFIELHVLRIALLRRRRFGPLQLTA